MPCSVAANTEPCQNGGQVIGNTGSCSCLCNKGYSGPNCEISDPCTSMDIICENGGEVVGVTGGCSCKCITGYIGMNC